ncbi:MAG TPA: ATP-binding protein, partial [Terrimicrobiaceae bacterium]|nr:ATP-binding protein [Terrimicrobiaceae bacterium]
EAIDVELRVFLGDLCRSLLSSKSGESERIDLRFPDFPIILKTRPRLLRRAVVNLLENALKYSSKDQTVIVKLDLEGNEIVISFIDSGRGVPSGSELLLFESFFRAPNAVGTPGTGLGLAIVSEAMKHIGGRVTYHPRPEGGSIFSMYLSYEN